MLEELAAVWASVAVGLSVHVLSCFGLATAGTPDQQAWLPEMLAGEQLGAYCLSEPQAGSDPAAMRATAVRDGDEYVLDGTKSLSFAAEAAAAVVFARTDEQQSGSKGISAFLVPLDLPGVTREPYSDMGTKAVGRGAVHFQRTRIPADHLLGREG